MTHQSLVQGRLNQGEQNQRNGSVKVARAPPPCRSAHPVNANDARCTGIGTDLGSLAQKAE